MRILLDEQLDWRLKQYVHQEHVVETVRDCGWEGKRNSELLRLAENAFDVLITMDNGIEHQQNLPGYDIVVILIEARSNRLSDTKPVIEEINRLLNRAKPGQLYRTRGVW